jgi:hypothetical protein
MKLAIDLQVVELQVLEVVEGCESGSEIVECQLASQCAQLLGQAAHPIDAFDRGGFGDLDDEAVGRYRVCGQQPRDVRGELGIADRRAGDVDAEHQVAAGGVAVVEVAHRPLEHPAIDLLDEAEALGVVEEGAGGDEVAVVVGQAQQQLEPGGRVGADRRDRLGVQHERVIADGLGTAVRSSSGAST